MKYEYFKGDRTEEFKRYMNGPHPEGPEPWREWIVREVFFDGARTEVGFDRAN